MKSNKSLTSIRIINEFDEVVEVTETGIPGPIAYQNHDINEELQDMEGFMEELRDRQSQYNGNDL